jgi:RND family efflux transporter MFP subunit
MRYVAFVLSLAVCGYGGWYLYQESTAAANKQVKEKIDKTIAVNAVKVQSRDIRETVELVGSLEAVSHLDVRTRVAGYVRKLSLEIEQTVTAGQEIILLDDRSHRELLAKAMAAELVVKAQVEAQNARKKQIENEIARLKTLGEISTEQQMEEAKSRLAVAEAEVRLEEARLDQAASDVKRARFAMEELRITTPIQGVVAERNVELGDLAKPEDVLMRIVDLRKIRTVVHVVERDYHQIKNGQIASIRVDAVPGRSFVGTVVRKSPVLDADTRTAKVIIEVNNDAALSLKPGMHARVIIVSQRKNGARVIPDTALHERDGRKYVYIVEGTPPTAKQREILTGIQDGDAIEVIGGLGPDAEVITLGSRLVKDGAIVDVSIDDWKPPLVAPLAKEQRFTDTAGD